MWLREVVKPMKVFTTVILLTALVTPLKAQWLERRTPGIPRTADGKPNLTAAAPRTADGKPDLAGLWEMIGAVRRPGDLQPADVQPWAQALVQQRAENFGIDNPRYKCLPSGPSYSTGQGFKRILQTPAMIVILQDPLGLSRPGDRSQPDLDGIFGRPLGRRHTGGGKQRIQRPDMADRRLSSYRRAAHDGALPPHRFRPPGHSSNLR